MLHDIYLALSRLKLVSKVNDKIIYLTPDDLYKRFIEFVFILSPDTTTWSFTLVTLLYNTLGVELQEFIRSGGYIFPNSSNLVNPFYQIPALQILREKTVIDFKTITEEKKWILTLLKTI